MEAVFHPAIVERYKGAPSVSHVRIAENTSNEKESVARLIRTHLDDFERFGQVQTQIVTVKAGRGTSRRKIYWLNEQQAYLIMTFLDNTEIVKMFKIALIQEFFKMRAARAHTLPTQCQTEPVNMTPQIMGYRGNLSKQRKKIEELKTENEELRERLKSAQAFNRDALFNADALIDLAGSLRIYDEEIRRSIIAIARVLDDLAERHHRTTDIIERITECSPAAARLEHHKKNK